MAVEPMGMAEVIAATKMMPTAAKVMRSAAKAVTPTHMAAAATTPTYDASTAAAMAKAEKK